MADAMADKSGDSCPERKTVGRSNVEHGPPTNRHVLEKICSSDGSQKTRSRRHRHRRGGGGGGGGGGVGGGRSQTTARGRGARGPGRGRVQDHQGRGHSVEGQAKTPACCAVDGTEDFGETLSDRKDEDEEDATPTVGRGGGGRGSGRVRAGRSRGRRRGGRGGEGRGRGGGGGRSRSNDDESLEGAGETQNGAFVCVETPTDHAPCAVQLCGDDEETRLDCGEGADVFNDVENDRSNGEEDLNHIESTDEQSDGNTNRGGDGNGEYNDIVREEGGGSLERARADLELLIAAYPEEIDASACTPSSSSSAISFVLRLPPSDRGAYIEMELPRGYPTYAGVRLKSYRGGGYEKSRVEAAAAALRNAAAECLECGEEGGLACCAAALEAWEECAGDSDNDDEGASAFAGEDDERRMALMRRAFAYAALRESVRWITGDALIDRKSVFQAHVCSVRSDVDVGRALDALIAGSAKIQRATHNMFAYRFTESKDGRTILKHDNNDDGEDGAGSRLAHLLHMREEDGIMVVVSRWYGGVHLGPKRFAHIINVARELLEQCHAEKRFDRS